MQDVVYNTVLPTPPRPPTPSQTGGDTAAQDLTTAFMSQPAVFSYVAQGHGLIVGKLDASRYIAEQRAFLDALRSASGQTRRPPGERGWMVADSRCRQQLWSKWSDGYWQGGEPTFDPVTERVAIALNDLCTRIPDDAFVNGTPIPEEVRNFCVRKHGTPSVNFCPFQVVPA